jgi:hypothetical protein
MSHASLLRSILHDFLIQHKTVFRTYQLMYRQTAPSRTRVWSEEQLKALFEQFASANRPCCIIIDALDEAMEDSILLLVEKLARLQGMYKIHYLESTRQTSRSPILG